MDKYISRKRRNADPPDETNIQIPKKVQVLPVVSKASGNSSQTLPSDIGRNKPQQPRLQAFPKDRHGRQFQNSWYDDFPWLEYSVAKDKTFCYPCRVYTTQTSKSKSAFVLEGFSNWTGALAPDKGFKKHNTTEDHKLSFLRWQDRLSIAEKKTTSINNQLDPNRLSAVAEHREYFTLLVKYHQYFLKNELPYRGDDETDESECAGKWREFINLQLDTNPKFQELHQKITTKHQKYDYTSKRSCNEMVEVICEVIKETIISEINTAGMYSILIDECKDNAGHEQLSICFRYLKEGTLYERFHSLHRSPETDAHHLVEDHIVPTLESSNITAALIGGGADGASVMSGCHEGVFVKLLEYYSSLIYVHCAAHRLNLVVAAYLSGCPDAAMVIKTYNALHTILNVANNREIFEVEQLSLYPEEPLMSIGKLTEVRWSCKFEGVQTMVCRIKPLLTSLLKIAGGGSNKADAAAGAYHKILSASFITSLVFLREVLAITDGFNKLLQEKTVDWVTAHSEFEICKKLLQELNIGDIADKVNAMCLDVDITTEYEDPLHATRRTLSDYFRMTQIEGRTKVEDNLQRLKDITVKKVLKDISHRFDGMSSVLMSAINSLDAATDTYLEYDAMKPILSHYKKQIKINETLLQTECQRAKIAVTSGLSITPKLYLNLQKIIDIGKTLPVSTATVERGFSCMRRIISYVRNRLTTDHASEFMLASLNKDLLSAIDIDAVIDRWASKKPRHIKIH